MLAHRMHREVVHMSRLSVTVDERIVADLDKLRKRAAKDRQSLMELLESSADS